MSLAEWVRSDLEFSTLAQPTRFALIARTRATTNTLHRACRCDDARSLESQGLREAV